MLYKWKIILIISCNWISTILAVEMEAEFKFQAVIGGGGGAVARQFLKQPWRMSIFDALKSGGKGGTRLFFSSDLSWHETDGSFQSHFVTHMATSGSPSENQYAWEGILFLHKCKCGCTATWMQIEDWGRASICNMSTWDAKCFLGGAKFGLGGAKILGVFFVPLSTPKETTKLQFHPDPNREKAVWAHGKWLTVKPQDRTFHSWVWKKMLQVKQRTC